ncbi:MAG: ATP synthase F1 subunit epsilon [Candidatus Delongbacteria bacterium]|nr:MAG: ATP synthase F1 subunit epsilon [Candidatus Delongbacteria bacterium]
MKKLKVEILSPTGKIFSGEADHLRAPGSLGNFGVLPNHAPLFSSLDIGVIIVENSGQKEFFATSGGYCEVKDNKISILAESSESKGSIDLERAESSKSRAEKRLASKDKDIDFDRAKLSLLKAINRIKVVKGV